MSQTQSSASAVIELHDLRKVFSLGFGGRRRIEALKGISLEVQRGQVFGFLGPNGSGKTTTIKTVTGLIQPTSGECRILGGPTNRPSSRQKLGYLPENPSFPDHLSAREVLRFSGQLCGLSPSTCRSREGALLEQVKLSHAADIAVRRFSKGMVQRLGLAQALIHEPELLILDEPMSGLDPIGRRDVKDLISRLRRDGRTIFFSTHVISDVEELCDQVAILVQGSLVKHGSVTALLGSEAREIEVRATGLPTDFPVPASSVEGGSQVFRVDDPRAAQSLIEKIWAAGGQLLSSTTRRYGLENIFLAEVAKRPQGKQLIEE